MAVRRLESLGHWPTGCRSLLRLVHRGPQSLLLGRHETFLLPNVPKATGVHVFLSNGLDRPDLLRCCESQTRRNAQGNFWRG
jgi:hypothetical protein